ncbi:MAG: peptidyl-prolyl cis-trans isomerase [Phycisphaerae bacterium]|nr:peptidyl-prolyl cis-trans isomerase [Phycisphaerae bacterium]
MKFTLPPGKSAPAWRGWVLAVITLVLGGALGFIAGPIVHARWAGSAGTAAKPGLIDAAELATLAETLEKNQLYEEAANAWAEASALAPPPEGEKAERLFRIGKNLHLAGRMESAIAYLLAAEAADRDGQWRQSIDRLVLEGLSVLGKEDVRAYQAKRRLSLATGEPDDADKPLGEIGGEPITETQFRGYLRRMAEHMLAPTLGATSPDARDEAIEAQAERLAAPEYRQQILQQYIAGEVMVREALATGVAERPDVREAIADARRQVLLSAYLDDYLASSLILDETDVKNAYEANKARYVAPEAIRVEAIVAVDDAARTAASVAIEAGTAFGEVQAKFSEAEASDAFAAWIPRDGEVPLVADNEAALAHLLALDPGEVSPKWFAGPDGQWIRFRLAERRAERQETLDECRDAVEADLRMEKQAALLRQLEQTLRAKYDVVIHGVPETGELAKEAAPQ